jgi:hypothetical protein
MEGVNGNPRAKNDDGGLFGLKNPRLESLTSDPVREVNVKKGVPVGNIFLTAKFRLKKTFAENII